MKIALVSYINTRPFMDGLTRFFSDEECSLQLLAPSACAKSLKERAVDMALIPVGSLPDFSNILLLPDFCIGADGPVNSVFIFSRKPIEEVNHVILDRHSRSSNGLAKILLRHFWKKTPEYSFPEEKHFDKIENDTAGVVIGDKAMKLKGHFEYVYDLSEYWKKMTGLPFAFAVWAYYEDAFTPEQIRRISKALAYGIDQSNNSALKWAEHYGFTPESALLYLTKDIQYHFTKERNEALELYLSLLAMETGLQAV
ncbi:MAG: menaquinone biosynthesis protein [Bacteroidia bacterium]|nr:menaquinone biosynthesis protein [Bacteroidia bacterium]